MCLREVGGDTGIAWHILPCGNWTIRASARTAVGDSLSFAVVELGLADQYLKLRLPAGESTELPEILFQPLPKGRPDLAAPGLHRYVLKRHFHSAKPSAPVVYNTWFDDFHLLNVERLRRQLSAAKAIGCEVFTVDAGWYGAGRGSWSEDVGDWREKRHAAFSGRMAEFADEVRAAGLGFGLWMEPERLGPSVPILKEHPDWFLPGEGGCHYPNLCNREAHAYVLAEMSRLIETYELAWMKIDMNLDLGADPSGTEFSSHYEKWYGLLDELRNGHPQVFFEGCASGGLRLDLNTLARHDGHFLSDNVNPADALRIYQGALLRLPPGRVSRWVVLRSAGRFVAEYGKPMDKAPDRVLTPCGATWDRSETTHVDFAARVALPGILGLTGDLAGLPQEVRERLRHHVAFFKTWREFMSASIAHLLTPPRPKEDHAGWAAIQLQEPVRNARSLLFVYRLDDAATEKWFRVQGLDSERTYTVENDDAPGKQPVSLRGAELMGAGIPVELSEQRSAAVLIISPT